MSIYDYRPQTLGWDEVDPSTHAFDPAEARRIIAAVALGEGEDAAAEWSEAMTLALEAEFGRWTYGWAWGRDESDLGGGPVRAWCCLSHSVTTPEETAERALRALSEWREWVEHLTAKFAVLALPADDRIAAWERAVAVLVTEVVTRTEAGDAWYEHCAQVLNWFLDTQGVPAAHREALIAGAIGGRFESWCAPDPGLVEDVGQRIAAGADRA